MTDLLDQYLGPGWAEALPDDDLWTASTKSRCRAVARPLRRREWMIAAVRRRLRDQLKGRGAPPAEVKAAEEVLIPRR